MTSGALWILLAASFLSLVVHLVSVLGWLYLPNGRSRCDMAPSMVATVLGAAALFIVFRQF